MLCRPPDSFAVNNPTVHRFAARRTENLARTRIRQAGPGLESVGRHGQLRTHGLYRHDILDRRPRRPVHGFPVECRMPDTGRQQTAFDLSANQDMGGRKAGLSLRFVLIDHFSPDEFPDFFAASPAAVSCNNDSPHVSSALPKHYHPCSDHYRPERTAAETSRTRQPVPPTNSSPKRFSRTTQINKKNRLHALHATCLKNIPEKRPTGSSLRAALRWNGSTPCAS